VVNILFEISNNFGTSAVYLGFTKP